MHPVSVMQPATTGRCVPASQGYQAGAQPRKTLNTSLSNLSGAVRAPDEQGKLTSAAVADMSDKEFDDLWSLMAKGSRDHIKF